MTIPVAATWLLGLVLLVAVLWSAIRRGRQALVLRPFVGGYRAPDAERICSDEHCEMVTRSVAVKARRRANRDQDRLSHAQ